MCIIKNYKGIAVFFLCFFLLSNLFAQQQVLKNLVFEGAGMRGIAYCGAIGELEDQNRMKDIEKLGGTSAGALMAMVVSLGYTAAEIKDIIASTDFQKLNDGRFFFIGGFNRLRKNYGWYKGERMANWVGSLIENKTGNADISFRELYEKGYKDLYVTATCLNRQQLIFFSRLTYPDMKVRDAVRISMSIPLYFGAVWIDKNGLPVRKPKNLDSLDLVVDGGFTGNFPITIFDEPGHVNPFTIGFRIDTEEQIVQDRVNRKLAPMPIKNLNQYLSAFYSIVIENLNRQSLTDADWKRTVSISDGNIRPRIRKLKSNEIKQLLDNGRIAMKLYLN